MAGFNLADMLKDVSSLDTGKDQITYLRMEQLHDDPKNFYQLTGIEELAANIELCGLQQPIRVRPDGDGYMIVSGHRRRAACRELGMEEVPCIIDRASGSPALQELRLIYANANTRVLTGAELATQTERVTELLYQLKNEGMEFPGRMRDHVAEAVGISTSKLARLKVIQSQLAPILQPVWRAGQLNETVAYRLAQMPEVRQKAIFLAQTKDRTKSFTVTADQVDRIAKEMDRLTKLADDTACVANFTSHCDHIHVRLNHAAGMPMYSGLMCRGCCCTCNWLKDCKYSCEWAAKEKQAIKDRDKQASRSAKEAREQEEAPKRQQISEIYKRVGALRAAANVTPEQFIKASTGFNIRGQTDRLLELESGKKASLTDRLPGSIWSDEANRLIATADLLGCSIDYLLGRDVPQTAAPAVWQTGNPTEIGKYVVMRRYRACKPEACDGVWNGTEWKDYDGTDLSVGEVVLMWQPWPEGLEE